MLNYQKLLLILLLPLLFSAKIQADVVIDEFSNGPLGGGVFYSDSNGPAVNFLIDTPDALSISAVPGKMANDNLLSVSLPASVYAGVGHTLGAAQDWSQSPTITFWLYGNNSGNELSFNLVDRDSNGLTEVWISPFFDNFVGWKNIEIGLDNFARASFSNIGDGVLNTENIEEWSFYAETRDGGGVTPATYFLDDMKLVSTPANVFGISIVNLKTGDVIDIANPNDNPAFNPSFSNNSKKLAYDTYGEYTGIYIADLKSGNTYPLEGGLDGNDASWSPNGKHIVFDRYNRTEIVVVPSGGGSAQFVTYGFDAEWSNTSKKIVYSDAGALKTINIDGSSETLISSFGINPNWSPNGKQIAFSDGENLWVVDVDRKGNAVGSPYQVTFDGPDIYNQQPSWSNNSKSLVFHSNRTTNNSDFDIWQLNISSGEISRLAGSSNVGDFDPSYSKNGKLVAFGTNRNSN
ncbi:carbohydrate binding domain-containing protein [Aliiglaciecola litoralis]|uniref:CBM11 domain-containing protein n=1 Tax=Aliiglaciecola litoralis TaxID=582857 RepID=A0ABP3WW72_9ALTE